MNIRHVKEVQKSHFDRIAKQYVSRISSVSYSYYFDFTKSEIISALKKNSKKSLKECVGLDVGSGNGDIAAAIGKECKMMAGCDLSEGMVRLAERKYGNIKFFQMPSDALRFKESSFDFMVSAHLFHHLADVRLIERTIAEMRRVVKNGGLIVIVDVNKLNPASHLIQYLMVRQGVDTGMERLFFPQTILSLFRKYGIREIAYRGFCFIPHFFSFARGINGFFDVAGINRLIGKDYIIVGMVDK